MDAARVVHSSCFVVIEKSRLAAAVAAGSAAHAGIAPMHRARCHWYVKSQVGHGVEVGFKLKIGEKLKEEGESCPAGNQGTLSPA